MQLKESGQFAVTRQAPSVELAINGWVVLWVALDELNQDNRFRNDSAFCIVDSHAYY
jgi:hypothetical protein